MASKTIEKYRDYFEEIIIPEGMTPEFPLDLLSPKSACFITTQLVFTMDNDNRIFIAQPRLNGCIILDLCLDEDAFDIEECCRYLYTTFANIYCNINKQQICSKIKDELNLKIVFNANRSKFNFLLSFK